MIQTNLGRSIASFVYILFMLNMYVIAINSLCLVALLHWYTTNSSSSLFCLVYNHRNLLNFAIMLKDQFLTVMPNVLSTTVATVMRCYCPQSLYALIAPDNYSYVVHDITKIFHATIKLFLIINGVTTNSRFYYNLSLCKH